MFFATSPTYTSTDGFFEISTSTGTLLSDSYGLYIPDVSGAAITSYLQVDPTGGLGAFELRGVNIGEYNLNGGSNNYSNVYVVGYVNGGVVAQTTPYNSINDTFEASYPISFAAFAGVTIDSFRVYFSAEEGTVQPNFNLVGFTVAAAAPSASTPTVSRVTSPFPNVSYAVGDTISVDVLFSQPVRVTGAPQLTLETGSTDRTAVYALGSGSRRLLFYYTVQSGDTASDLDYVSTSALVLNGGTIMNGIGTDAALTLPTVGSATSLGGQKDIVVDGIVPTISSVSVPANATYVAGQNLDFTVNFDQVTTVNTSGGTPSIGVILDTGGTVQAAFVSGSGTSALLFRCTIVSGNFDATGIALASAMSLNGATLRDAVGNNGNLTLHSVGNTAAVLVDAVAPAVNAIVRAGGTPTNATSLDYTVTFSENISGVDAGDFMLTPTATAAGSIAAVSAVNGSTYTVTVNSVSGDGTLRVDLKNSGTGITDTTGTAIGGGFTSGQTYTLDNTLPSAPSVASISNDNGASATDSITNDPTLVLAGSAEANSTVTVLRGGTPIGTSTADGSGAWILDYTATTLGNATYVFTATASDAGGNTSATSSPLNATIDTNAPAAPVITAITNDTGPSSADQLTTDTTLVLSGTAEANGTVAILRNASQIGVVTANGAGVWSFDYTGTALAEGTHTFTADTTDAAGNMSSESPAFLVQIDVSTPVAPVITGITDDSGTSGTDGITNDATLVLSGTADANATVTVSRNGIGALGSVTANGSGAWTFDYSATTLADGAYIFTAFASDAAGNAGAVSADFPVTIDTNGPAINTPPVGATYAVFSSFDVSVGATDDTALTYQWRRNGTPVANDANRSGATTSTLSLTNIAMVGFDGAYSVVITDLAGNNTTSTPATVVVTKADQTITFPVIPDQLPTDAPFTISATASSGFPVTFSVVSGPATLSGDTVTINGVVGSVTVRASAAGDSNYNPAAVDRTFVVAASVATVTLGDLSHTYDGAAKTASATTSPGGLTVAFTYNGGSTAPVNAGSYAVVATVVDGTFTYHGTASGTLTIGPAAGGVTLGGLAQTYTGTARVATATTTPSGLSVGLTYNGSATAPINAGSYAVAATVTNANYVGGANGTLVVGLADQTINFASVGTVTVGVPVALGATASSGLPVTFAVLSGNGVVSGASFTANDGNPITLRALQAGNSNYNPVSTDQVVSSITKLAQTITFAALGDKLATDASFALSATASSGLPVNLAVQSGPAIISGNSVTLTGTSGTVTVVATQAGNASYAAASQVVRTFVVKQTQTITLAQPDDKLASDAPFTLSASASSGLPVSLGVQSGPAIISGNTVTLTGAAGTVTIVATQAGNASYVAAPRVLRTFVVKQSQTITLAQPDDKLASDAPFALSATASSGLPVSLAVQSGPATISGNTITLTGVAGDVTIVATQAGNASYAAAPEVTRTFTAKQTQTITFAQPADKQTTDAPFALSATASSGLPVSLVVQSGPANISGNSVTLTGTSGTVTIVATQAGNASYAVASEVVRSFAVKQPQTQTIAFAQPADRLASDAPFALSATASSGLPVSFAVQSGPATISGSTVTLTGATGNVTIVATQDGNASYAAAPQVSRTFAVTAAGSLTYFGTVTDGIQSQGEFAAHLAADQSSGVLIGYLPGQPGGFVVNFTADSNRAFSVNVGSITNQSAGGAGVASAPANWTFNGQLSGNTITGSIAELALTFSGVADPLAGPAAPLAGYYKAAELGTSAGTMHIIVGTMGEVQALAATPDLVAGAAGVLIPSSGDLAVTLGGGATIDGNVNAATNVLDGTLVLTGGATTDFLGLRSDTVRKDRLANISTRGRAGSGENILITGFAIAGTESKKVLIRAVGPGLTAFGVPGVLPNPRIALYRDAVLVDQNDDWGAAANVQEVADAMQRTGAFALGAGSLDAALVRTLAPGSYTAHISDPSGQGVALAEIYDASEIPGNEVQRLVNISTRGHVGTGDNILIGGFIVSGNAPKRVLVRAIGPTLSAFGVAGVLADSQLKIFDGNGAELASNNDWGTGANTAAELAAAATTTGAFALNAGSLDSAVYITLAPGSYTAHVSGINGGTGVALIEVYEGQLP